MKHKSIYKITNLVNGKIYIGQTVNPSKRWSQHKREANKAQPTMIVNQAMKKYGVKNFIFEIIISIIPISDELEYCKLADELEEYFIIEYQSHISIGNGYNVSDGGPTSPKTEEWKKKVVATRRANNSYKHSEETKQKLSETWHQDHSMEDLRKMQESNIGRKHFPEHGQKISKANKGKQFCLGQKQSKETINKRMTTINEKYGDKKCNAPGCDRTDGHKIGGVKYCTMHGQRLCDTGTLDLRPRPSPPNKGKSMSIESKEKLSAKLKGRVAHNKGKPHTQETIDKLRQLNLGKEPPNKVKLTEDQMSIVLSNKPRVQVARELDISPRVVDRIRKSNKLTA